MSIRVELLEKAMRDRAKLVQVQRFVTRKGKSFWATYWVSPGQVLTTDKVLANKNVLDDWNKKQSGKTKPKMDFNKLMSLKNNHEAAYAYIDECGIKYEPNNDERIDWLNAIQACKKECGIPLRSPHVKKSGPKAKGAQQNSPTASATAPNDTVFNKGTIKLSAGQIALIKEGRNGAEKRLVLREILGSGSKMMEYAKGLGLTWKDSTSEARNIMSASMALKKYFDDQFNTSSKGWSQDADSQKLLDRAASGNYPDTGSTADSSTTDKKDEPKKDPDAIEVPKDATERDINMINLINSISDRSLLQLGIDTGMLPEDDIAKDLVENYLHPAYVDMTNSRDKVVNAGALSELFSKVKSLKSMSLMGYGIMPGDSYGYANPACDTTSTYNLLNMIPTDLHNMYDSASKYGQLARDACSSPESGVYNYSQDKDAIKNIDDSRLVIGLDAIAEKQPELASEAKKMKDNLHKMVDMVGGVEALVDILPWYCNSYRTPGETEYHKCIWAMEDNKKSIDKFIAGMKKKGFSDSCIQATLEAEHQAGSTQLYVYDKDPNTGRKVKVLTPAGRPKRIAAPDRFTFTPFNKRIPMIEYMNNDPTYPGMFSGEFQKFRGLMIDTFQYKSGDSKERAAIMSNLGMMSNVKYGSRFTKSGIKTADELRSLVRQLPIYSVDEISKVQKNVKEMRDSATRYKMEQNIDSTGENFLFSKKTREEHPAMEVLYGYTKALYACTDNECNGTPIKEARKDFSKFVNKISKEKSNKSGVDNSIPLKELRENVFSRAKCSLRGFTSQEKKDYDDHVKRHWSAVINGHDLYAGKTHESKIGAEIRNSKNEESFNKAVEEAGKAGKSTNILHHFHGTKMGSAQGILGETGRFASIGEIKKRSQGMAFTGAMLGYGVYSANLVGKAAGYYGQWGNSYGQWGVLLGVDVLEGKSHNASVASRVDRDYASDTVSLNGKGNNPGYGSVRAPEWCSRNPDYVCPRVIMVARAKYK